VVRRSAICERAAWNLLGACSHAAELSKEYKPLQPCRGFFLACCTGAAVVPTPTMWLRVETRLPSLCWTMGRSAVAWPGSGWRCGACGHPATNSRQQHSNSPGGACLCVAGGVVARWCLCRSALAQDDSGGRGQRESADGQPQQQGQKKRSPQGSGLVVGARCGVGW